MLATGAMVVVVVGVLSFWGDTVGRLFQSDMERIQGRWKVVSIVVKGGAVPENEQGYFIFEDEGIKLFGPNGLKSSTDYSLDDGHDPGWVDLLPPGWEDLGIPEDEAPRLRGIYELKGNTLRICLSGDPDGKRPTTFESKADSRTDLIVLQRE